MRLTTEQFEALLAAYLAGELGEQQAPFYRLACAEIWEEVNLNLILYF
jgi:hypothetical protein